MDIIDIVTAIIKDPVSSFRALEGMHHRAKCFDYDEKIFYRQDYYWLYSRIKPNSVLIDIGEWIGDTAIYFSMNPNVKRVVAFEPIPTIHEMARQHIDSSPFKSKIKLINGGVGGKHGAIDLPERFRGKLYTQVGNLKSQSTAKSKRVEIFALDEVLKGIAGKNIAIKCDVGGNSLETAIFENADLSRVYSIQVYYHDTKDKLLRVLKGKGFKVEAYRPRVGVVAKEVGYIKAWR